MHNSLFHSAARTLLVCFVLFNLISVEAQASTCKDKDNNCKSWIRDDPNLCRTTEYVQKHCRQACGLCVDGKLPDKYNLQKVPHELKPLSFLIGRWRSEHGGKARFPTIPVFTYGEELDFSIAAPSMKGPSSLNYTSFAWSINSKDELHSEYGFFAIKPASRDVALTVVMNNGFTTVEEGEVSGNRVNMRLQDIARMTFSRDLPVHDLTREWVLVDRNTLEQSLDMETLTHPMQQHTFIRYKKIFP